MRIFSLALAAMLILLALLVGATSSVSTTGIHDYDPWCDFDDDGDIDIFDIVEIANRYGSTGVPVNKTALLYNVSATLNMLLNKISELNSTVMHQQTVINSLNNTMVYLNETVTLLNSTGLRAPDYDSGWGSWPAGNYFTHNLNTTDLLVYFVGRYNSDGYNVAHQYSYGSQWDPRYGESELGAWWATSNTTIVLFRGSHDFASSPYPWDYVRVLIWKIPQP
jgi:hypothetical protein